MKIVNDLSKFDRLDWYAFFCIVGIYTPLLFNTYIRGDLISHCWVSMFGILLLNEWLVRLKDKDVC